MEQKFIDRDGLKVLWNQVNLKDYPNNETLMAVIDAIDETKANKDELFSKSWNDLEDRPFYKEPNKNQIVFEGTSTIKVTFNMNNQDYYGALLSPSLNLEASDPPFKYEITINENSYLCYSGYDSESQTYVLNEGKFSILWDDTHNSYIIEFYKGFEWNVGDSINIKIKDTRDFIYKYLSDEFLPANLGRSCNGTYSWQSGENNTGDGNYCWTLGSNNVNNGGQNIIIGRSNTVDSGAGTIVVGASNKSSKHYWGSVIGQGNNVTGVDSSAHGCGLIANSRGQFITGRHNKEDNEGNWTEYGTYVHIVGNGAENKRSNAHTLDWDGNAWFAGDVYIGGTGQGDENVKKLATEEYVDSVMPSFPSEMEALALVTEIGFVEPVTNNGYVLTDENGAIYTI